MVSLHYQCSFVGNLNYSTIMANNLWWCSSYENIILMPKTVLPKGERPFLTTKIIIYKINY